MNLFMVFLFATAIVACGGNAETEAPEGDAVDSSSMQEDVAPMEEDTTGADSTDVHSEEGHDEAEH